MSNQEKELYGKFMRLQRLLHRYRVHSKIADGPRDASVGQGRVLAILKLRPEIGVGELSYLLGIRPSSLNELLNKLERNGYVTRTASPEDKRAVIVRLTEKGAKEELPDTGAESIFTVLTDGEKKTFEEIVDKLLSALEEKVGNEKDGFDLMGALRGRYGPDFGKKAEKFGDDLERGFHEFGTRAKNFGGDIERTWNDFVAAWKEDGDDDGDDDITIE